MKIFSTFSSASENPATPPLPAADPAELLALRSKVQSLQDELATVKASLDKKPAEPSSATSDAVTAGLAKAVRELSDRLQSVEKHEAPSAEKIATEVRAALQKELAALDARVTSLSKPTPAPTPAPAPDLSGAMSALEKKWSDQADGLEKRLKAQDQALEQIRQKLVAPVPAPVAPPPLEPARSVKDPVSTDVPLPPALPESESVDASPLPLPDDAPAKPSLWIRFWHYLNAPAFAKDAESSHD